MRILIALALMSLPLLASAAPSLGDPTGPAASSDGDMPAAESGSGDSVITSKLTQGALTAAGIDPAATSEIIQPNNLQSFIVTVRAVGGILQGAEGSTSMQFNPYMAFRGNSMQYQEVRKERTPLRQRLQDSVIALSISSSTPYPDDAVAAPFFTLGAGLSVELLGNRSVFADAYEACLDQAGERFGEHLTSSGPPPETQEELEAQTLLLAEVVARQSLMCKDVVALDTHGLFLSVGGRWVLPTQGTPRAGARIQRSLVGVTWDYTGRLLTMAVQGRLLGERLQRDATLSYFGDLGASLHMEQSRYSFSVEATQTVAPFGSATQSSGATLALNFKYKFSTSWGVALGAQGRGHRLWDSQLYIHPVVAASVLYEDAPVFSTP